MKKLFYLLFAFAIIVACEKDMDDNYDSSSINPIEATVESSQSVDVDAIKETIDRIMSNAKNYETKDRSTSRSAGGSVRILSGTEGTTYHEFLFSDNINVCNEANYAFLTDNIYLTSRSDNGIDVRVGTIDATPLVTIDGNFSAFFLLNIFEGITFDFVSNALGFPAIDGSVITLNSVAYDFGCTTVYEYGTQIIGGANDGRVIIPLDPLDMDAASNPTAAAVGTANLQLQLVRRVASSGVNTWEAVGDPFTNPNYVTPTAARWEMTTPGGVMTFTRADMGSYKLEAAPFPLSGLIATVISEATGVEGTLNYAGTGSLGDATTHAAVRNAIETSFAN